MATVRVTMYSLGYPRVRPNCLLVLQSLCANGYKVVMKDSNYKDREAILNYFDRINIPVEFVKINNPDIDILNTTFRIGNHYHRWDKPYNWSEIDKYCLNHGVYSREAGFSFVPVDYLPDTFFVVKDYGESTQEVDSMPISYVGAKQKSTRLCNSGKANTVTIVDANSFRVAGVSTKDGYTELEELVYFNNEL